MMQVRKEKKEYELLDKNYKVNMKLRNQKNENKRLYICFQEKNMKLIQLMQLIKG